MPRATRPRIADPEPEESPADLIEAEDNQDDGDDEIEDLLSSLTGGGRLYATVYRVDDLGEEQWQPGRLAINPEEPSDALLERIFQAHGPGVYHLQVRQQGVKGTRGNAVVRIGGKAQAPSPPAAVQPKPDTDLRDLLMRQNDKLMELLVGRGPGAPAAPAAPTTIDGTLDQLKKLFGVARGLAREQSSPAIPAWMNTLGEIAAPFLVTMAAGLNAAGNTLQRRHAQPQLPRPTPTAGAATPPSAAPADPAPAEAETPQTIACRALAKAELAQPNPDPARLAAGMWSIASADIAPILSAPPGLLAAALVEQNPALLEGREDFARAVEDQLRRLHQPETPPCPAPSPPGS